MALAALLLVILFGFGIGATGIGGVGVVPTMVAFAGIEVTGAVAIAHAGFLVTGCVGYVLQRRALQGVGRGFWTLVLWAALGTTLGAALLPFVAGRWLELALGLLMIGVGGFELVRTRRAVTAPRAERVPRAAQWRLIGAAVGIGSALTGTGGPILFVPIMLLLGAEPRRTVALAQMIQIPVAGAATIVHAGRGALDLRLGALVATLLVLGFVAGSLAARRLGGQHLRLLLAVVLVAGGTAFLVLRL